MFLENERMKRAEKREHLVETATALFRRLGYHAVGVDQVIAEAGIAKTTLYRHFGSKEELIVAVLRKIDDAYRADMRRAVDRRARDPKQKLLATFDFLEDWFRDRSFHGCPFISAASEYSEHRSAIFREAMMHKRLVVAYFEELAHAAQLGDPKRVADEINLLHEGATAVAHISGAPDAAQKARAIAARLIAEAGGGIGHYE